MRARARQCDDCGAYHAGKCLDENLLAEAEEREESPLCSARGCRNTVAEDGDYCEFCDEDEE